MELALKIPLVAWLLVSAIFFAGGEYFSKIWALAPGWRSLFLVLLMYNLGTLCWLPALLQKNELALLGTIWLLLGSIATVVIGTVVFQESLTTLQWSGIAVGLVALAILAQ